MANLEALISRKTEADTQWKAQRQAERESIVAMQDAGVTEITSNPEAYVFQRSTAFACQESQNAAEY